MLIPSVSGSQHNYAATVIWSPEGSCDRACEAMRSARLGCVRLGSAAFGSARGLVSYHQDTNEGVYTVLIAPRNAMLPHTTPIAPRNAMLHRATPIAPRNAMLHCATPIAPRNVMLHRATPIAPRNAILHRATPIAPLDAMLHMLSAGHQLWRP